MSDKQTPVAPEPAAAPPRLAAGKPRTQTVQLEWPLDYAGRTITEIQVRRLTGAEVVAFQDYVQSGSVDDSDLFALVADLPAEAIRALDQDDWFALREVVLAFLPRRFREAVGLISKTPGA